MGSWDETCMVTQLPITPGDLVKLVFIRWSPLKDRPFNGGVYHTDTCEPIGGPIECTYEDYGRYEPVEEDKAFAQFIVESIRPHVAERDWGENTCHDVPTWKKDLAGENAFANLTKIIQEDRLLVQETILSENRQCGVAMVAIHKDIFDAMISDDFISNLSRWVNDRLFTLDKHLEKYDEYLSDLQEQIRVKNQPESDDELLSEAQKQIKSMLSMGTYLKLERMRPILATKWDLEYLQKSLLKNSENQKLLLNHINKIAQLDCFNDRLSLTRQQWMPQCGHGSQSTEYKANQFVFEAAIKLADEKIKDQEWLYKDEDDE